MWDGTANQATGVLVEDVGEAYYHYPQLLYNPTPEDFAYALDQAIGLDFTGNLWEDGYGQNERWLQGDGGEWVSITPDGTLRLWDGTPGDIAGPVLAILDPIYYKQPERLYNAQPNRFDVVVENESSVAGMPSEAGATLKITTASGYVGDFVVQVIAEDGTEFSELTYPLDGTETNVVSFAVDVTNIDPTWTPLDSLTLGSTEAQRSVSVMADDPDNTTVTTTAEVAGSMAYFLDQDLDLTFSAAIPGT